MADPATLERLNSISETEWKAIYASLVVYADAKLCRCGFGSSPESNAIKGEDFVGMAIEKLFNGERKWDFEHKPDIAIHLKLVVKSLIWNYAKSLNNVNGSVITNEVNLSAYDNMRVQQAFDPDQSDELVTRKEMWDHLESNFTDEDEYMIFLEWCDGKAPREIAVELSVDATKIYAVIKKGKRLANRFYQAN